MRKILLMFLLIGTVFVLFFITPNKSVHAEANGQEDHQLFEVKTKFLTMRTAPDEGAEIVGHLVVGNKLRTFEEFNGWVKTFYAGQPVWVMKEHISLIEEQVHVEEIEPEFDEEQAATKEVEDKKSTAESHQKSNSYDKKEVSENAQENFTNPFSIKQENNEYADIPTGYLEAKEMKISENTIMITKQELEGVEILLDPGHGGKDSGATKDKIFEKNLALSTAKKVAEKLSQAGASVHYTRENDTFISLENRVKKSNSHQTDAFISLHFDYFNDPEANGVSTYFYNHGTSKALANEIHSALMDGIPMADRGVRTADYYVLVNNLKPSVLLELGFMTSPTDFEKIQTEEYQDKVAKAITDGLVNYFNQN
ncbi:N-acetylmuramoyl-L-alanine amidase [Ornithinibacillus bavariensis]|uniref:N-acetylmuramoyl-L-alanine amidase n=1 Tax=Ornithinibacillus bavariensis TaxID=545502 RepID=UPI000EDA0E4B|nr:hypothetical protein [Ornithinibacillus sp.]